MKKLILPLFAVLALTACGNDADGTDGADANDTTENAVQGAGTEMTQDAGEAANNAGDRIDNATDSMDLHYDKNDVDGKDTLRK
jgi:hypothetical protein